MVTTNQNQSNATEDTNIKGNFTGIKADKGDKTKPKSKP